MLTEMCPLDCTYCYIEDRVSDNNVSLKDVDTLINNFSCENPRIIFFGGEPFIIYVFMTIRKNHEIGF